VSLSDRLARLGVRERRLLGILVGILGLFLVLLLPIGLTALVHSRRSENEAVRKALADIDDSRDQIERGKAERAATLERYARPAPPLAAFLAGLATTSGVEIPESQDRQAVPHGKKYSERTTKIALHRLGMLKLAKFMESIEQSGHPVVISQLDIRKRGSEPDSYDVDMVVSAFDRKASDEKPVKPAGSAESTEKLP
jgi:general secretion pathway protein M